MGAGAVTKYADEVTGLTYANKLDIDSDFKGFNLDDSEVFFKNADEVVEGGLNTNYNVLNTSLADDVNNIFKETMGYESPYKPGKMVTEIELTERAVAIPFSALASKAPLKLPPSERAIASGFLY